MSSRTQPHWIVDPDTWIRLDHFLAAPDRLGSRGRARTALERGKVFVNDVEVSSRDAGARLAPGDVVRLWEDRPGSAKRRLGTSSIGEVHIIYEDEVLLVINKPAGLLTVPLPSREHALSVVDVIQDHLRSHRIRKPFVVHRIDRDTSGLVVFAKDARAQDTLKRQFVRHEPERVYRALVWGHPEPDAGTWRDRLAWDQKALKQRATSDRNPDGEEAISEYRVITAYEETALIEVRLHTGKQNQIRIQAALRGHALIGEQLYAGADDPSRSIAFPRQALHAYRLAFDHPIDGRRLEFEAKLPADFKKLIRLQKRRV